MNRSTSFLSVASYLLPVAIVTCASLSYAATANNQMSSLSDRLLEVGRHFGDGNGMILVPVADNTTLYVATSDGTQPYSIYTGQPDESTAVIAACTVDSTGAPERCHEAYGETMLFAIEDLLNEPEVPRTLPKVECHELSGTQIYCKLTLSNGTEKCWLGTSSGVEQVHC
jgi:hypothetical protein